MMVAAALWIPSLRAFPIPRPFFFPRRLGVVRSSSQHDIVSEPPERIAIVGGGLAGLSTAFHLLERHQEQRLFTPLAITILDKDSVGTGGASAVAGGLVHPLSPRGKLVYLGVEGVRATEHLVQQACQANPNTNSIVLRRTLSSGNLCQASHQLQQTAHELPSLCQWMTPEELFQNTAVSSSSCLGGLRLFNGCQVLHVPSYLQGVWAACQSIRDSNSALLSVEWKQQDVTTDSTADYDATVWAAGAGLLDDSLLRHVDSKELPVQLVRGQSVEIRLKPATNNRQQALLSGKYVSPLPDSDLILVGATHEFDRDQPLTREQVKQELQERTEHFCPHIWDDSSAVVERNTDGTRVQSQRGSRGRLPIVGQLQSSNDWIFTGLSSRGLLYHGVYGKLLAHAILERSEACLEQQCSGFDWWRGNGANKGT
ncbi:oxidoreductase [Seminavis robusta]|uniref:Oxidoreductase n=1 Tax=Seminavis robusta TaxID=568900 RepID=A0A9N8DSY1_9STRA|nr:oxidoreductase [Seminavis robusta]|eukprot:Sro331_g119050.1 oxidoreductase (427) ;mRNA; r:18297-19841